MQPQWTLSLEPREGPYFLGERIHVRLCPASTVPEDARPERIEFEVEPREGWRDPIRRYRESDIGSFISQRMLRSYQFPEKVEGGCFRVPFTDWVRFVRPGEYRVGLKGANAVKLLVARPTPQWEAQKLATLLEKFDAMPLGSWDKESQYEIETLETDAAVRAMIHRMTDSIWPGLLMQEDMARLRQILEEELSRPTLAVTYPRFNALTRARLQAKGEGDLVDRWERSRQETAQWVAEQIGRKSGEAWRVTRATLQANAPELAPAAPRPTRAQLEHLTDGDLAVALRERWQELRDDSLIEVLRPRLRAAPPPADFPAWREWEQFTGLVLRRLMEIDEAGTRALLIRDLKEREPRYTEFSLRRLEGPIAELDERLLATWADSEADAKLMARFGSPAIAKEVATRFQALADRLDCLTEQGVLEYLMRAEAKEYGAPLVRQALTRRENRGCYRMLLENLTWSPVLEEIALERLADEDLGLRASVIRLLGREGSPRVEAALWKAFEAWHADWKYRVPSLPDESLANDLENAFVEALSQPTHWWVDRDRIERIRKLSLRPRRGLAPGGDDRVIQVIGSEMFTLGHYSFHRPDQLSAKIRQYPRGTRFEWRVLSPGLADPEEVQGMILKLQRELRDYVHENVN